jgi:predicted small lipoprotein YifL
MQQARPRPMTPHWRGIGWLGTAVALGVASAIAAGCGSKGALYLPKSGAAQAARTTTPPAPSTAQTQAPEGETVRPPGTIEAWPGTGPAVLPPSSGARQ